MPYVPPAHGSTVPGLPTPAGVPKQNVHITDLPPEVRKSFLLSMVFFPSLVGGTVCLIMFLAWWTLFSPKEPAQYARELGSLDARHRWQAARELAENIAPSDAAADAKEQKIYDPVILTALIQILQNKDLDKETEAWSPTSMIKQEDERGSRLRWWAAPMIGHFAAKLPSSADKERGLNALVSALDEKDLAVFAAQGLSLLKDVRAREALVKTLETDKDAAARAAAAHALGAIGEYALDNKATDKEMSLFREPLRHAYQNSKERLSTMISKKEKDEKDEAGEEQTVLDNTAIALARLKDSMGKERLQELTQNKDAVVSGYATKALQVLDNKN